MKDMHPVTHGGNTLEDASERDLIALAQTGDPAAFAELYRRHLRRVFQYLLTYTDSSEDAADLTQHVFLRALEALPRYQDRGLPFRAWLFRIARNAATDTFRRRRRALPWEHVPEALHPLSNSDPEAISLRRDDLNQVRILIGQLDPAKQELLALRSSAALSSREIALLVERSEAAVQKEMVRVMHTLKEGFHDAER